VETKKKRSRADVLKQLKQQRGQGQQGAISVPDQEEEEKAEDAIESKRKDGKFKPIGFKPITAQEEKLKKKKVKDDLDGKKKKKRKLEDKGEVSKSEVDHATMSVESEASTSKAAPALAAPLPDPEPMDEDFDIFTGAGEYEGLDLGDDEEGEDGEVAGDDLKKADAYGDSIEARNVDPGSGAQVRKRKGWFDDEEEPEPEPKALPDLSRIPVSSDSRSPPSRNSELPSRNVEEDDEEQPVRLQPLASSTIPSIKDILAVDEGLEKEEKRRARKEKKKGGGGGGDGEEKKKKNEKGKLERDYQRCVDIAMLSIIMVVEHLFYSQTEVLYGQEIWSKLMESCS
jgi:IK cytokine